MRYNNDMDDNRDFEYSRPLDVHKWSDHKEVNNLVNDIYENYSVYDTTYNLWSIFSKRSISLYKCLSEKTPN